MKLKIISILSIIPIIGFTQNYTRKSFEYEKLKLDTISVCDNAVLQNLEQSFMLLQQNNSKNAVRIAKQEFEKGTNCPEIFEVYGYTLFRSGEWFEGIDIIEKGIEKFGRNPNLIKRKSEMSLEMAELGTIQKNIDGNSVYKANSIKYDEEQFKTENYNSALKDLEFLVKEYNRNEEKYYVGKIYQILKNYEKSNEIFFPLINDEELKKFVIFNISENYIALKRFDDAEKEINKLLVLNSKDGELYEKLAEIYELKNEKTKSQEFKNKSIYYNNIPSFSNLDYSIDNFNVLKFFGSNENDPHKKINKLNEIAKKGNNSYTIDVCLIILKIHANHGNGVEEKATEILAKIGQPSLNKVHLLFQSNVSTCTITNLSEIMATIKDETSWELLKAYLPSIANMPMTLIPPAVPEKMIQFDEEKGTKEILIVVKQLLNQNEEDNDAMNDLNSFGQYVYFSPLKKVNKTKLKKIAAELNYSQVELKQLEEKLK